MLAGPSVVEELVHRRADRASREEYVIDQDERSSFDFERDVRAFDIAVQADDFVIIPIKGHVERPERNVERQRGVQALGQPDTAGVNSDEARVGADVGPHALRERQKNLFGIRERLMHGYAPSPGEVTGLLLVATRWAFRLAARVPQVAGRSAGLEPRFENLPRSGSI